MAILYSTCRKQPVFLVEVEMEDPKTKQKITKKVRIDAPDEKMAKHGAKLHFEGKGFKNARVKSMTPEGERESPSPKHDYGKGRP